MDSDRRGERVGVLGVIGEVAGIAARGREEAVVLRRDAAFNVDVLGDVDLAVARAINHRDLIGQILAQIAEHVHAPIGRVAEAGAVGQVIFDVAHAGLAVDEGNPWHVGRTHAHDQRRIDLGLQIGKLQIQTLAHHSRSRGVERGGVGILRGRTDDIAGISGDVRREDVVELVINRQIDALHIYARAVADVLGVVALAVNLLAIDVREVEKHRAADLGVGGPFGGLAGLGDSGLGFVCGGERGVCLGGDCGYGRIVVARGGGCRVNLGLHRVDLRLHLGELLLREAQLLGGRQAFFLRRSGCDSGVGLGVMLDMMLGVVGCGLRHARQRQNSSHRAKRDCGIEFHKSAPSVCGP